MDLAIQMEKSLKMASSGNVMIGDFQITFSTFQETKVTQICSLGIVAEKQP